MKHELHNPPLVVMAVGGNAISAPTGTLSIAAERAVIDRTAAELAAVARDGGRLLIVHGNGPQVGRLLAAPGVGDPENIDVHVAQTQGELGYLLAEALDTHLGAHACVALVTRVLVDPNDPGFTRPTKPVGPVLPHPPTGVPTAPTPDGTGWRRVVPSPRPIAVVEQAVIGSLLATHHVVAGGGGGVALAATPPRHATPAVIDKDWVAALLAIAFHARLLVFVTDVPQAFDRFGEADQAAIHSMTLIEARERLSRGVFAPGSMGPKVESAVDFVEATGRWAVIATGGHMAAAMRGETGTTIRPAL